MTLSCYIDGSCQGNPGDAGYGVIIKDENKNILEIIGNYIGEATNNIAEYQALIACLEMTEKYNMDTLIIHSDSQLVVNQIKGFYKVKQEHLKKLFNTVQNKITSASHTVNIVHIPREQNKEADSIAKRAIRLKKQIIE
jgi:ribonuclease HI